MQAHRAEDREKFTACLARFSIDEAETATGHGLVMDRVYDALIAELNRTGETIDMATP